MKAETWLIPSRPEALTMIASTTNAGNAEMNKALASQPGSTRYVDKLPTVAVCVSRLTRG